MKQAILDAARSLFIAEGFDRVTVRKISDQIEYSHSAIYSYFSNKDEVFLALAEEGYRLLTKAMLVPPTDDPMADLRRSYWQYYQFSKAHPEYFALMFLERSIPALRDTVLVRFVHAITEHNTRALQRCVAAGLLPPSTDVASARQILWASMHGPAVSGLIWPTESTLHSDAVAARTIDTALTGLRAAEHFQVSESQG